MTLAELEKRIKEIKKETTLSPHKIEVLMAPDRRPKGKVEVPVRDLRRYGGVGLAEDPMNDVVVLYDYERQD